MYAGRGDFRGLNRIADGADALLLAGFDAGGRNGDVILAEGVAGGEHFHIHIFADGANALLAAVLIAGGGLRHGEVAVVMARRGDRLKFLGPAGRADALHAAVLGAGGLGNGDKLAPVVAERGDHFKFLDPAARADMLFAAVLGAGGLDCGDVFAPVVAERVKLLIAEGLLAGDALLVVAVSAHGAGGGLAVYLDADMVGELKHKLIIAVLHRLQRGRIVIERVGLLGRHHADFRVHVVQRGQIERLRAALAVGAGLVEKMGRIGRAIAVGADILRLDDLDKVMQTVFRGRADIGIEHRVRLIGLRAAEGILPLRSRSKRPVVHPGRRSITLHHGFIGGVERVQICRRQRRQGQQRQHEQHRQHERHDSYKVLFHDRKPLYLRNFVIYRNFLDFFTNVIIP